MKHNSINDKFQNPLPVPFVIGCDVIDRLQPLDISGSAMWFANLVADRIADTGKHVDDLTVREVRTIIEECRVASEKAAKKKLYWWKY